MVRGIHTVQLHARPSTNKHWHVCELGGLFVAHLRCFWNSRSHHSNSSRWSVRSVQRDDHCCVVDCSRGVGMLDPRTFKCCCGCVRGAIWILDWRLPPLVGQIYFGRIESSTDIELQAAALVPHITKNQQTVPLRLGLQFLVVSVPMIVRNTIARVIRMASSRASRSSRAC